jgi:hypothetical protein
MSLSTRRAPFGLVLAAALLAGVSAHAQIGGFIKKKLPKLSVPGVTQQTPPPEAARKYCGGITDELLDKFLKGLQAENAASAREAAAKAKRKAAADAASAAADRYSPAGAARFEACKSAAAAKDPRTKERDRLSALADAALKKTQIQAQLKYSNEASELTDAIDAAAEEACGGGVKSLQALSGAENREAAEAMIASGADSQQAGVDASGLNEGEYGKLKECVLGRLQTPKSTPTTPDSDAAIDKRSAELKKALNVR